jgi:inorganic pyrophosphatase
MQGSPRLVLSLAVLLILCFCSTPLLADDRHLVRDFPPRTDAGLVNVVFEIPAGTNAKWEVVKESGRLEWEQRGGRPRVVYYLAYPGNYGMVPRTLLPKELGGDGDPLDVIVLGPAPERGSVVAVRLIGILELLDGGEQDDKLIAVLPGAPLGDVASLVELDKRYVGISQIVKLWFANYNGPDEMEAKGFGDPKRAFEILESAISAYAEQKR